VLPSYGITVFRFYGDTVLPSHRNRCKRERVVPLGRSAVCPLGCFAGAWWHERIRKGTIHVRILAVANQKGGTGKTSTTVNLAAALSRADKTVLLVDMDPQGSLTEYFVNPTTLTVTVYHALLDGAAVAPLVIGERIHLIPATIDLAAAEIQLPVKRNEARSLSRFLRSFAGRYDYCLLDCPRSLGLLTANALTAPHHALVPLRTELMADRTAKLSHHTAAEPTSRR